MKGRSLAKIFLGALLTSLCTFSLVQADTTSSLLAAYAFEEGSGTSAGDSSGNGKTGTLVNSPTWTTSGKTGNGLVFNGSNTYVSTPVTTSLSKGSISAWVNPTASVSTGRIYNILYASNYGNSLSLDFGGYSSIGNPFEFTLRGNYGSTLTASSPVASNTELQKWHHLVATWDVATGVKLYVDGVLKSTVSGTTGAPTFTSQALGASSASFQGTMDDVKVYGRVLTASDVAELYAGSTGTTTDVTPPVITSIVTSSIATSSATITWSTDELADSQVLYGTTTSYGFQTTLDTTTVTSHNQSLSSLTPSTTYHYLVKSKDGAGNLATSTDYSFTTASVAGTSTITFTAGIATYLGQYDPPFLPGCTKYPTSITDYSRFTYDSTHNQMLMFGGGHSAAPRDDVDVLNTSTFTWNSAYPSTPIAELVRSNYDTTTGGWISSGHPQSRHTYDGLVYAPNKGELVLLATTNLSGYCMEGSPDYPSYPGVIWHYNPVTKVWHSTTAPIPGVNDYVAAEYDPSSGKIIILGRNGMWVYDPITEVVSKPLTLFDYGMSIAQNLVYYPPNQKMYYILSTGDVYEVTLNRSDFSLSTVVKMTGVTGALPAKPLDLPSGETGWAYDPINNIIGGAVTDGVFYAFNPITKVWTSTTMTPSTSSVLIGSQIFHTLDYDTADNAFIFISQSPNPATGASVYSTWGYRYQAPTDVTPPTISAVGATTSTSSAVVSFTTNEVADTQVEYGSTTSYGLVTTLNASLVTSHSQVIGGLTPSTLYHYRVKSKDGAGNLATSTDYTLTTASYTPDTIAPSTPANLSATTTSGAQVSLAWDASTDNIGVAGYRVYRNDVFIASTPSNNYVDTTAVASTSYLYIVGAYDAAGNESASSSPVHIITPQPTIDLTSSLLAAYAFEEGSGTSAGDSSGNGKTGTLVNSPTWTTSGKTGNGLVFNGSNTYVSTPVTTSLSKGSISAWVNPTASVSTGRIYNILYASNYGNSLSLDFGGYSSIGNPFEFTLRGNYGSTLTASSPVASNTELQKWHHLVATWDVATGVKLYVDGVLKSTVSGTTGAPTFTSQALGASSASFQGTMDDVKVYGRVLTAAEVNALYNQ